MPMIPNVMAASLMNSVSGMTSPGGVNLLWNAVCDYVDQNAMVNCTWSAVSATVPPVTDPLMSVVGSVLTAAGRTLTLPAFDQATTAEAALGILSTAMNLAVQSWQALLPTTQGFLVSPGMVMVPSTIALTPSMATSSLPAFTLMASQIIQGLMSVTFSPVAGSHLGIYNGAGVFLPGIF
jgi:hypothetical protein